MKTREKLNQRAGAAMKNIVKLLLVSAIFLVSPSAGAADLAVEKVEFAALPGNQVEIRLGFNGVPPEPTGYSIQKPARIALDVPGAKSVLESKHHNLGTGNARSMTVVEARDRTRIIINLNELVAYRTRVDGNSLVVTVGEERQVSAAAAVPASSSQPAQGIQAASSEPAAGLRAPVAGRGIAGIDFRRRADGEGQVVVNLSHANIPVDVRQDGNRVVVEFTNATLPVNLRKKLDVTDFATPVTSIVSTVSGNNVIMQIEPRDQYDYLAYQADKELIIGFKPVSTSDQARRKSDAFMFTGEKLSLNFQDIEVRSVLQLIADFTSLNLVASDTVSGRITLRLQNVPWDQALDLVLKTKRLDKRQVGNVLLVAPADEIAAREKQEMEAYNQTEALAPLRSEFIQINYAKASDLEKLLKQEKSLLSGRGSITVDGRTNMLIVAETAKRLEDIRDVIRRLDVPVKQVLIEARMVLATDNLNRELGVAWGGFEVNQSSANRSTVIGAAPLETVLTASGSVMANTTPLAYDNGLAVDMRGGGTRFSLGLIKMDSGLLAMELSALASEGQSEIVATPKVLTADRKKATISSQLQIPYLAESASGGTKVDFMSAELKLDVTPQITPDGKVIMELVVTNGVPIFAAGSDTPSIEKKEINTLVAVDDGDTLVLGGVFKRNSSKTTEKTPFFGDLPMIGRLFRRDQASTQNEELLIFITPKIVKDFAAQG